MLFRSFLLKLRKFFKIIFTYTSYESSYRLILKYINNYAIVLLIIAVNLISVLFL